MALLLREKHVRTLLSMHDTITVLEDAFTALAQGTVFNQPRSRLSFPHGVLNYLAAATPGYGVFGYKTYTASRERLRHLVMLFSSYDGQLLALIEANWLGALRTGAASALAAKYLARPEASVVGLIGAGNQAVTQLMGICSVHAVTEVFVYSRRRQEREFFCHEMSQVLNLTITPVETAQQAVEAADILITATTAREPVFRGEWVRPGCHIAAIGSNWSQRRELGSDTLHRCSLIVTDSLDQAHTEAGDFIIPAKHGEFVWDDVYELAFVVSGEGPRRELPEEITLYKGLGIALEDIAAAARVYYLANQHNVGEEIDLLP
ncbi:MAG: alanine dehydrogenase [Ktedonobacteraceae bacterium]